MLAPPPANPTAWKDIADEALKVLALLVGAAWTLLQYWRTHPNRQKPEVIVEGRMLQQNEDAYLSIHASMKNVGQREYCIDRRGTSLRIWELSEASIKEKALPDEFEVLKVFSEHRQMEAGTTIHDNLALALPKSKHASVSLYRIELRVRVSAYISAWRKMWRSLFRRLLTRTLKAALGNDFESVHRTRITERLGTKFDQALFSFTFDELFVGVRNRKAEFREIFGRDFGEIVERPPALKMRWWRFLFRMSQVDFTIFRTNCLVEPLKEPVPNVSSTRLEDKASTTALKETADADPSIPVDSHVAVRTAAV